MKALSVFGAAAIAMALAVPAHAVDVTNEDDADVQIIVTDAQGSESLTLTAKEAFPNVCEKCSLKLGDQMIEVEGDQVAIVRGGKLSVKSN